jgi:hypothetical protein
VSYIWVSPDETDVRRERVGTGVLRCPASTEWDWLLAADLVPSMLGDKQRSAGLFILGRPGRYLITEAEGRQRAVI